MNYRHSVGSKRLAYGWFAAPCLLVVVGACGSAQPSAAQESRPGQGSVITTYAVERAEPEKGLGADQRARISRVHALILQKQLDQAEKHNNEVLVAFQALTNDADRVYVTVASREQLTQFEKLQQDGRTVVWIDWAFGDALKIKAHIAVERKQPQAAVAALDLLIRQAPFRADAWAEKGLVLASLKRPAEALKAYEQALDLAHAHVSENAALGVALRGIGYSAIELGRLQQAREALELSLEIEPGNSTGQSELNYLATAFAKNGQWSDAVQSFSAVAKAVPTNAGVRYRQGLSLLALGDLEQFDSHRRKMLLDFAQTAEARDAPFVVTLAVLIAGEWETADIERLNQLVTQLKQNGGPAAGLEWDGMLSFRLGKLAAARAAFEKAAAQRSATADTKLEQRRKAPAAAAIFAALVDLMDGRRDTATLTIDELHRQYKAVEGDSSLSWEAKVYTDALFKEARARVSEAARD